MDAASRRPGPANGFPAKLQRQGPRAEAERNAGCTFAPRSAAREDCQAACRRPNMTCTRGFSPDPKPGAVNFSVELAATVLRAHCLLWSSDGQPRQLDRWYVASLAARYIAGLNLARCGASRTGCDHEARSRRPRPRVQNILTVAQASCAILFASTLGVDSID